MSKLCSWKVVTSSFDKTDNYYIISFLGFRFVRLLARRRWYQGEGHSYTREHMIGHKLIIQESRQSFWSDNANFKCVCFLKVNFYLNERVH